MDICICGWRGKSFEQHHEDTIFEDVVHVETSPLIQHLVQNGFLPKP